MESLRSKISEILNELEICEEPIEIYNLSLQILDVVKEWLKAGLTDNSYFLLLDEHK